MTTGYKKAGVDIDTLLEPKGSGTAAATDIKVNGVDLNTLFAPVSEGSAAAATGFKSGSTDIGSIFAAIGSSLVTGQFFDCGTAANDGVGQLADGISTSSTRGSLTRVGALSNWKKVVVAAYHTAALKTDGTIWGWGNNISGQLGNGTISAAYSPIQFGTLNTWKEISVGGYSTFGIKTDGTLWGCGGNGSYNLGIGNTAHRSSPVQIGTATDWDSISANQDCCLAIKTNGTLWSWGTNGYGALGLGSMITVTTPVQIGTDTNWSKVSNGYVGSCLAIKTNGTLWAWGYGGSGCIGNSATVNVSTPIQVGALTNWASLATSKYTKVGAIKTDGTLWLWGSNDTIRYLGDGTSIPRSSPVKIGTATDWVSVSIGGLHTLGYRTNNGLWGWGGANNSSLTNQYVVAQSAPVLISSKKWGSIAAGDWLTYVIGL